jgi:lycopene cyclase domain-containing protein
MTYTGLAGLAIAAVVVIDGLVLRTNLVRRKAFWTSYAIIVAFQLLVNGVLTGLPVVRYNPAAILGWRIGYAPVEDLLFGFAMVLLTLSMWVWLGRRARAGNVRRVPSESTRR